MVLTLQSQRNRCWRSAAVYPPGGLSHIPPGLSFSCCFQPVTCPSEGLGQEPSQTLPVVWDTAKHGWHTAPFSSACNSHTEQDGKGGHCRKKEGTETSPQRMCGDCWAVAGHWELANLICPPQLSQYNVSGCPSPPLSTCLSGPKLWELYCR